MTLQPDPALSIDLRWLRSVYRALGDETRLRIIGLLAEHGQMPVNELSARVALSQPLISWHLRILRLAGVITTRRHGRETLCQIRLAAFDELREAEARLLSGVAAVNLPSGRHAGEVPDVG
jgi:DNA-binding transcriptional ArsR family regulator